MKNTFQTAKPTAIPREVVRVALASALVGASFGLQSCSRQREQREHELTLSGNIEVVDVQLGFKIPGRVVSRAVSEGQPVSTGDLVARLDDTEQKEQLAFRKAELGAALAFLAELEAGSRPQEIAAAEAAVRSAEADVERLKLDYARSQELLAKAVISARDFEASRAQVRVAEARWAEATERLKLIKEGPRSETLQQARSKVEQARAAVVIAETQVHNTYLNAPFDGMVLSHNIEAGEYVSPGTPVLTIGQTARPWVRAYVDQADLGIIKLGQKVFVQTDSFPDKSYHGVISFIASEAEFTPKAVQTTKERVKLVFRVKVDVDNPDGELKPGMPADVVVSSLQGKSDV